MRLESAAYRPHPALLPYVAAVTGYRQDGLPPGVHHGLPSPYLTLVVTVDEPLQLAAHADPRQPAMAYDALIGGLHTRPVLIAHPGHQWGVQVSLTPLGARALLGAPAAALASWDAHLSDVVGRTAIELTERVRTARDWPGRFGAIESVLLRLARTDAALTPEIAQAWRVTTAAHGRLRVEDLAYEVGWSARHLGERFRAEIGLTPKAAARVVRFDTARRALARRVSDGRPVDLAAFAIAAGYYDQAHLTREWRSLSGLPPSRWLRDELGFVQDVPAAAGADSAA